MQKQETIAATMRLFMESGPSITEFTSYKTINDYVGALHGLPAGKVQALAGPKAWAWAKDETSGKWREATEAEIAACRANAATKNHGGPRSKVLSDADRAALDAQIEALQAVNNPALAGLLAGLKAQQVNDDTARKGSLKDRLQAAVDRLRLSEAVRILEAEVAADDAAADADLAAENA